MWDLTFEIFVDECISYALTTRLHRKTPDEWKQKAFELWIRYFGPMWWLCSDLEGAVISDLISKACEHWSIQRDLGGRQRGSSNPCGRKKAQTA